MDESLKPNPGEVPDRPFDWSLPAFGSGIRGVLERIAGPGATGLELSLQLVIPVFVSVLAVFYSLHIGSPGLLKLTLVAILAFDIAGGVITNSTSSAKRWYHRPGQTHWHHLGFIALHIVHLSLVCFLFEQSWYWMALHCAILLGSAAIILLVSLYVQRPVCLILYATALLITVYTEPIPGLEWFLPLFYLKLLVAHLPVETPFRPEWERGTKGTRDRMMHPGKKR